MKPFKIANWSDIEDRKPTYALVADVDLVIVRYDDKVSVLYGRCLHRGALMSDGYISGDNLMCGVHHWDYRYDTGVSEYNHHEVLTKFKAWVDEEELFVDEDEIIRYRTKHPQPFNRDEYLGLYADPSHDPIEEDKVKYIEKLAKGGIKGIGHHGLISSMGIPREQLPRWDDIQLVTAQLARPPLLEHIPVDTELVIGPRAKKPMRLKIPIFVSDMSFGALSEEAKLSLAKGAEMAGTGICSGEGGMLPEEQASNRRYFYELASGKFGWDIDKVKQVQAFHFKGGQGAKTGTGGHLPGEKVVGKIAQVRSLAPGTPAISPPCFSELKTPSDFKALADEIRDVSGGIPIGFKLSAQHIESDIDFALESSADYIILDGRGGATGAAPNIFKKNISVPTMVALARARRHLDAKGATDVTLIITGGLRTESDFIKAMALGADGVAVSNAAMQAIGCLGMRACSTNNCPVGIATQKEHLRNRLIVAASAQRLYNWFDATVHLMQVLSRACGHHKLSDFSLRDLSTCNRDIAYLAGVPYAGVTPL
ncbi:MAG: glutamate synthase-related protein [Myxococcota bacterium]|nr:glutamate synthase-related protein [Myxococcota bacterium]